MFLVALIVLGVVAVWIITPFVPNDLAWQATLLIQYVIVSLALTAWLIEIKNRPILYRSSVAMLTIIFWVQTVSQITWIVSAQNIDIALPLFIGMCWWVIYLTSRSYETIGDKVQGSNVFILFLRPRSNSDIFKSFFGRPVASVCIYCNGYVWSYRRNSRVFERNVASKMMLTTHMAYDTNTTATEDMINALNAKIGQPSGNGLRCVYILRDVLQMLSIKPKTPFHYLPGVYANQLLRKA